ncbi:hypothetical protein RUMCAL_01229, partial [Ruminococcus callidus ATCC 27760]
ALCAVLPKGNTASRLRVKPSGGFCAVLPYINMLYYTGFPCFCQVLRKFPLKLPAKKSHVLRKTLLTNIRIYYII